MLVIMTIALLIYLSIISKFWTRLGWLFEDVWHWLKSNTSRGCPQPQPRPTINKSKYIFHCSLFTFKKCRASPAYCADEDVHNPSVDGLRLDARNKQKTYTLNSFGKS
ncbi:MAG: hypothetical protein IJ607_09065 [Bacteroidaceae bacterium]|nr:hypothetical protein [Bacteroidaceae bacterium]